MDPFKSVEAQLQRYKDRFADEITAAMEKWWHQWIATAGASQRDGADGELFDAPKLKEERFRLAAKYLRGDGIEIGALHNPLPLPDGARVKYVDHLPVETLGLHYGELAEYRFVEVDIVDDGETLETIADGSLDFVIANHFLEHCQDPLGALASQLRVLRQGGVIYCAVPDKRFTFDRHRELTPFDHLLRDHREGPEASRREHYRDYTRHVLGLSGEEYEACWRLLDAVDHSIHFHVWTSDGVLELLLGAQRDLGLPFGIREFVAHGNEGVFILMRG